MNDSKPEPRETTAEEIAADGENFLSRWSRLKRENTSRTTAPPQTTAENDSQSQQAGDNSRAQLSDSGGDTVAPKPPPDDSEMPPLDSLDENADIGGFLSPRVSAQLQKRALRKVFLSGKFNVRDGLDDYDDDFTSFAPLGDVITAEMRRMQERIRARAENDSQPQNAEAKSEGDFAAAEQKNDSVAPEQSAEETSAAENKIGASDSSSDTAAAAKPQ